MRLGKKYKQQISFAIVRFLENSKYQKIDRKIHKKRNLDKIISEKKLLK